MEAINTVEDARSVLNTIFNHLNDTLPSQIDKDAVLVTEKKLFSLYKMSKIHAWDTDIQEIISAGLCHASALSFQLKKPSIDHSFYQELLILIQILALAKIEE